MKLCVIPAVLLMAVTMSAGDRPTEAWENTLFQRLPLYGHRNWIVVADSAYPAQSRDGIETIVSHADHFEVLQGVLEAIGASRHVRPIVYTDEELRFVRDEDAPGVFEFRSRLADVLRGLTISSLPHEQIIAKLDQAGQTFRVLIIKTKLTIPYTSVFLQLDCGYWSSDAEQRLRNDMAAAGAK